MIISSISIQGQNVIYSYNHLAIETVRVIVNSSSQSPFGLNVIEYNEYQSINNRECNLNDKYLLSAILFECKCVLYFIDVSKTSSFNYIKNIDKKIIESDTNRVIVFNKSDLVSEVSEEKVNQFANEAKIDNIIKISLLTNTNFSQLLDLIYTILYETFSDFEVNPVYEIAKENDFYQTKEEMPLPLNILLLGSAEIGKTCLVERYMNDSFRDSIATIGINLGSKYIKIGEEKYKLQMWDTAGAERFRSINLKYFHLADGIFLLFDVLSQYRLEQILEWITCIKIHLNGVNALNKNNPIIYLIGNKIDSNQRVVRKEEVEKIAKEFDIEYYEVSIKLNLNIIEVVTKMVNQILFKKGKKLNTRIKLVSNRKKLKKKNYCAY